jgi:hypothetical protein
MKTLIRTAIIVIVSLVVIGGAFAYVQYGGNVLLASGPGRGEFGQLPEGGTRPQRGTNEGDQAFTPPQGDFAGGEGLRREGGREAGGLRGLTEVFKNLGIMAAITLVVVIVGVAWRAVSSKLRRPPTVVAPPPPPVQPTT